MLPQILVNSVIAASVYLLVALGFSLIYSTARFFHFAHGAVIAVGAYAAYFLHVTVGFPFVAASVLSVLLAALLGCSLETLFYKRLRRRGASELVLLLASLGLYIVIQNLISIAFGDATKSFGPATGDEGWNVLGARVTPVQVTSFVAAIALMMLLTVFMLRTTLGKKIRAVANDAELASVHGIDTNFAILLTFAIGSALAAIAGILIALDVNMRPTMGMHVLLMGVVVTIVGGLRSFPGIALGALLIGFSQHIGGWVIGSEWQEAIAFVVMLLFLLFRPQGIFGTPPQTAVA